MNKQELFKKTVKAMDNYNKALEMGFEEFENYFDTIIDELYQKIEQRGLIEEFEDYALC